MRRGGAVLLYRATCAKCRGLSLAVVWLTRGWVRRIPLASPEASTLYAQHGVQPGKLALVVHQRMFVGWSVLSGLATMTSARLKSR